jgi:hypothetical protein
MNGPRLPKTILEELEGLDWTWEPGAKHWKLRIGGSLVAIWPRGVPNDTDHRKNLGVRAHIRRWRREHDQGPKFLCAGTP